VEVGGGRAVVEVLELFRYFLAVFHEIAQAYRIATWFRTHGPEAFVSFIKISAEGTFFLKERNTGREKSKYFNRSEYFKKSEHHICMKWSWDFSWS
jgi:hypothetical protein